MIDAAVTQIGFPNGEFGIRRRKIKGLAISIEKYIVQQLVLPPVTSQSQRVSFGDDSARDLE